MIHLKAGTPPGAFPCWTGPDSSIQRINMAPQDSHTYHRSSKICGASSKANRKARTIEGPWTRSGPCKRSSAATVRVSPHSRRRHQPTAHRPPLWYRVISQVHGKQAPFLEGGASMKGPQGRLQRRDHITARPDVRRVPSFEGPRGDLLDLRGQRSGFPVSSDRAIELG